MMGFKLTQVKTQQGGTHRKTVNNNKLMKLQIEIDENVKQNNKVVSKTMQNWCIAGHGSHKKLPPDKPAGVSPGKNHPVEGDKNIGGRRVPEGGLRGQRGVVGQQQWAAVEGKLRLALEHGKQVADEAPRCLRRSKEGGAAHRVPIWRLGELHEL